MVIVRERLWPWRSSVYSTCHLNVLGAFAETTDRVWGCSLGGRWIETSFGSRSAVDLLLPLQGTLRKCGVHLFLLWFCLWVITILFRSFCLWQMKCNTNTVQQSLWWRHAVAQVKGFGGKTTSKMFICFIKMENEEIPHGLILAKLLFVTEFHGKSDFKKATHERMWGWVYKWRYFLLFLTLTKHWLTDIAV